MTSMHERAADELEALAAGLRLQQGMAEERAAAMASKIAAADDDIWQAALSWSRSGELPEAPEVEGYSPRELGERLTPSAALTALMALRRDPQRAGSALRHHVRRPAAPAGA